MKGINWPLVIFYLIILYGIYKYGFYGYLKNRKDTRSKNINKLVNYIN
jgi:F0F1-type ATP synthase membrane subunit a